MSEKRYTIKVHGRVQGVGYRYFCRTWAYSVDVSGWVRNSMDGTVELEAQGQENKLELFLAKLQEGPTLSRVDKIDKQETTWQPEETEFEIRY